jgi:transposase
MAYNFLAVERDQLFLLPPSLLDWLPEDHLAWFILDAVAEMDLDAFYAGYRTDGWGGAAHEPSAMVALLLYAYCQGVRSSRQIERACHVDVAFRVIAANQTPDHTTIARFRQRHEEALAGVFSDSLRLCAAAGMASVGTVALDGTKMGCPGSLRSNATAEHIEAEVQQMLAEAAAADAHDDATFGESRGDEPPATLRARDDRRRRFAEAKAALEDGVEEARVAHEAHLADRAAKEQAMGRKLKGRKPKDPRDKAKFREKKANTTDPESKTMSTSGGFLQGYKRAGRGEREPSRCGRQCHRRAERHSPAPPKARCHRRVPRCGRDRRAASCAARRCRLLLRGRSRQPRSRSSGLLRRYSQHEGGHGPEGVHARSATEERHRH